MKLAAGQANNAYNTAANTASGLGASASGIGANLTPFLTQEMLHPQGIGQQGIGDEQAAVEGAAGGTGSGLTGLADQRAAVTRNAGGYQAALADAARSRTQAAATGSEGIAAGNEQDKLQQQEQGAAGLSGLYKTDTSGMLDAMGQEQGDIKAEETAPTWMSTAQGLLNMGTSAASLAGGFKIPGFQNFGPQAKG
jgi:hypothetical protein